MKSTYIIFALSALALTGCAKAEVESSAPDSAATTQEAQIEPENCAIQFEETTEHGDPEFITLLCDDSSVSFESDENRLRDGDIDSFGGNWRATELSTSEHTEGKKWTIAYEGSLERGVDVSCEASAFAFHATTTVVCDQDGNKTERITSSDASSEPYPASQG